MVGGYFGSVFNNWWFIWCSLLHEWPRLFTSLKVASNKVVICDWLLLVMIIFCLLCKGKHLRVILQLGLSKFTLHWDHLSVAVGLVLVADWVAFFDHFWKCAELFKIYGRVPSIECKKARTNESPAFLAPN